MSADPLFPRADHVGSLIPSAALEKARARFASGIVPREELDEAEDQAVERAVRRQRDCGLPAATDGGFRFGADGFFAALTGVERVAGKPPEPGAPASPDRILVTDRLGFPLDHPILAGIRSLVKTAGPAAKAVLPSPGSLRRSLGADAPHVAAYREDEALLADLRDLYAAAMSAIHDAGCRVLQFDDDAFFALAAEGGHDARRRAEAYAGVLRDALSARPADLQVALYLGAGAGAGPVKPGMPEAFAELVFSEAGVAAFLVDPEAVPVSALRFLPARTRALLGLVGACNPTIERLDALRRAVDAAGEHIDPERLGIATDRGFADAAEPIGEDAQWRKLDLVVEAAERIWGGVSG